MNRELIAAFVETITAERGSAANTVAAYTRDLESCGEFLDAARRKQRDGHLGQLPHFFIGLRKRGNGRNRTRDRHR